MSIMQAVDAPWAEEPSLPESQDATPFPRSWRLLDDVQVMALPDPRFLVNGVIQDRAIGVLYSPPGTGKTTAMASLAVAVATGYRWFGHAVLDPGAVIYVATEDPAGWKVRLRAAKLAVGLSLEVPLGIYTFPEPIDLGDAVSVARFEQFVRAETLAVPLKLVIVDTYAAATPGAAENSSEDTTIAMLHAQRWRDALDCGVLMAHHTNAGGTRERGHSAMRGAADFMISMTPLDDLILLECSKIRNGKPFDKITLKLTGSPDGVGCVLRPADEVLPSDALTHNERRAYEALRDTFQPADGATRTEWQEACTGMAKSTFYRVVKTLTDRGYVESRGPRLRLTTKAVTA